MTLQSSEGYTFIQYKTVAIRLIGSYEDSLYKTKDTLAKGVVNFEIGFGKDLTFYIEEKKHLFYL